MLILFSILLACVIILVGVLLAYSPGKANPFLDENGRPILVLFLQPVQTGHYPHRDS
jgi:hypothetical protein